MNIKLKSLRLTNYKGIRQLIIDFFSKTDISGKNEAGKTSILNAFLWLLFGKDFEGRADHEIKTLDENNEPYHRLDHEVEGVFDIDGNENRFRRCYKEKWIKKKGSSEAEFSGHETSYYWNDVPMQQKEYQQKISELIQENLFKLITNTHYFNSLKWQDRRAVLLQIAGKIDNAEILDSIATVQNKNEILQLTNALNQNKTIEQFKSELAAKKKRIKDELDLIPSRIDEANRGLPEETDYSLIEQQIESVKLNIDDIDGLLQNSSKAAIEHNNKVAQLEEKKRAATRKGMEIEHNLRIQVSSKRQERENKISDEDAELKRKNSKLINTRTDYTTSVTRYNSLMEEKKAGSEKYNTINIEVLKFDDAEFCCPACKRSFETNDIEAKKEEITKNFNRDKSDRLNKISARSIELDQEIEDLKIKITNLKADGEQLALDITKTTERIAELKKENDRLITNEVEEFEKMLQNDESYLETKKEVINLDELISQPFAAEDNSALKERKIALNNNLNILNQQLATKGIREKQLARINELKDQESNMSQELASFEGVEFCIEQFTKASMDILSSRINGRFKLVRFKLFESQVNGGESPCCETLINGVPYTAANTASQINAGLDIINTLCDHYNIYAPVFVDNAESVNKLIDVNSQLIRLIVSADQKLIIQNAEKEVEVLQA